MRTAQARQQRMRRTSTRLMAKARRSTAGATPPMARAPRRSVGKAARRPVVRAQRTLAEAPHGEDEFEAGCRSQIELQVRLLRRISWQGFDGPRWSWTRSPVKRSRQPIALPIAFRPAVPEPTEWQRIGDQIDAAFVTARADFVNVL